MKPQPAGIKPNPRGAFMNAGQVLDALAARAAPRHREGMARFGINTNGALGIPVAELRKMARTIGKDHALAQALWASGIHEARLLATMVDDPALVTEAQMEQWVRGIDSWDVCDGACGNLFDKTPFAYRKAKEWSVRPQEFVKRASFALMAWLAVHDKEADDKRFVQFLRIIHREAGDERHFVKKAVNWALRQIGKRNARLRKEAVATARAILKMNSKSARWIAQDALRELVS